MALIWFWHALWLLWTLHKLSCLLLANVCGILVRRLVLRQPNPCNWGLLEEVWQAAAAQLLKHSHHKVLRVFAWLQAVCYLAGAPFLGVEVESVCEETVTRTSNSYMDELQSVKGYWVRLLQPVAAKKWNTDRLRPVQLYYIHGGGFVTGHPLMWLPAIAKLLRTLAEHGIQANAFCVHYHLAPENPFPAGLHDCQAGYLWLQSTFQEADIIVCGDSAGANLALSMLLSLSEHFASGTASPPLSAILLSPFLNVSSSAAWHNPTLPNRYDSNSTSSLTSKLYSFLRSCNFHTQGQNGALTKPGHSLYSQTSNASDCSAELSSNASRAGSSFAGQHSSRNSTEFQIFIPDILDDTTPGMHSNRPIPSISKHQSFSWWQPAYPDVLNPTQLQEWVNMYVAGNAALLPHPLASPGAQASVSSLSCLVRHSILIAAGGVEILLPDMEAFVQRASHGGCEKPILLLVEPGRVHNYMLMPGVASENSWRPIVQYVYRCCVDCA